MTERGSFAWSDAAGYALVRALADAGTPDEAVERLLEVVGVSFGWAAGELWLADEREALLHEAGSWSFDEPELVEFRDLGRRLTFARGVGLPGRVWASGEPVWVRDLAADPNFPRVEAARRAHLRTAVGLPVHGAGELLGVMEFFADDVQEPDPVLLERMQTAARQAGVYLARASAEHRLRATEENSAAIFEAALDCIIMMDADGRVIDMNPAAEATFGYVREDARGRPLGDLVVPEELREAHERALRRYVKTRRPRILDHRLELTAMRADGSRFPVELTVTRLGSREPPRFAGFVRDLTARRRLDEQLAQVIDREHQARLEAERAERAARRVSDALQRSLLPPHLPAIPGVELGAVYHAVSEGSLVGGDFYDVFQLAGERWGIVIGDVSGKGADAASLTALVRYTLRAAAVREQDPRAVLAAVNDALLREPRRNAYCTLVYAGVAKEPEGLAVHLAIAGHPLPLVVDRAGETRFAGSPGTILGAIGDPPIGVDHLVIGDGQTLVLYTDGVTEARGPRGLLGADGLRDLVRRCAGRPPDALVACVAAGVRADPGTTVTDDIALLAVRGAPG